MATGMFGCQVLSSLKAKKVLLSRILTHVDSLTGVTTISLNNPPTNDLCMEMVSEIAEEIEHCEKDPAVRGILLTSKPFLGIFSSGLNALDLRGKPHSQVHEYWENVHRLSLTCFGCTKPLVVAVNGKVDGAGSPYLWATDCRTIQKNAKIQFNHKNLGLMDPCFVRLLSYLIGTRHAESTLIRGKEISSHEALTLGLVDSVHTKENIETASRIELGGLMEFSPAMYASRKLQVRGNLLRTLTEDSKRSIEFCAKMTMKKETQFNLEKILKTNT